jgi:hypothetical protein
MLRYFESAPSHEVVRVSPLAEQKNVYWKAKQAEIGKDEESKRKRLETRDNREKGWEVAHVDEWSNEEEPHEQQEIVDTVQQDREQEDNSSGDEEETLR